MAFLFQENSLLFFFPVWIEFLSTNAKSAKKRRKLCTSLFLETGYSRSNWLIASYILERRYFILLCTIGFIMLLFRNISNRLLFIIVLFLAINIPARIIDIIHFLAPQPTPGPANTTPLLIMMHNNITMLSKTVH